MMTRRSRSLACAWATLFAMVFSALSPVLAAAVLADRPAALAQMLGIPGRGAEAVELSQADCHYEAPPGHTQHASDSHGAPHSPGDAPAHEAHGIYCSFCLNASSTLAVPGAPALALAAALAAAAVALEPPPLEVVPSRPHFRSRAPPAGVSASH
jgi:hypothetical protein